MLTAARQEIRDRLEVGWFAGLLVCCQKHSIHVIEFCCRNEGMFTMKTK